MACSFHPFPRLPTELQLQVWIAACLPYHPYDYGIHYIDVEPTSTEGTPSDSYDFTACLADGDKDSACLRNGGIWTACKESRDVMLQYSKTEGHYCARVGIRGDEEDWYSPVCPTHDIFCIKSKTWNTPDDHDEGWQIQIPGMSPKRSQITDIDNIAFEFDESWNRDIDTDYVQITPYLSSRHCLGAHDFDGVLENAKTFISTLDDLYKANENRHVFTGVRVKTTMSLKYPKMSNFLLLDTRKSIFEQTGLV
ncbi:tetracycline resistance protein [Fusarium phyllophilum]|uniref:Tetracycline resistance protein n=1 Tax=Fusarium phyllophilum TaxID=47803 RepID=A0A8H5N526_9HYPO|nr:tetracycline resistance protein [Fusarium phyllophilum]